MPWCSSRSVCSHRSHFISCSSSPHSLHASHTGLLIPQTGQGQSHSGPLHVIFSLECPPFHGNLISSFLLDPYSEVSLSSRQSLATATKISLPRFLLLITIYRLPLTFIFSQPFIMKRLKHKSRKNYTVSIHIPATYIYSTINIFYSCFTSYPSIHLIHVIFQCLSR